MIDATTTLTLTGSRRGIEGMAWEDCPEAMAAADKLVGLTGLVPGDDDDLSMAASSGVL